MFYPFKMFIRKSIPWVISTMLLMLCNVGTSGQQTVNLDKALSENPELFTGNFSRIAIGFSRSSFNYGSTFDGVVLSPLHIHLDLGKRMSRNFGAYFNFSGDLLMKSKQLGSDWMNQWIQAGLHLGGSFYFLGGNSYVAPEIGLGLFSFGYQESLSPYPDKPFCAGLSANLRYGYDWHISGKVFLGGQIYISYSHAWETGIPESVEAPVATSFIYGAALTLKLGK